MTKVHKTIRMTPKVEKKIRELSERENVPFSHTVERLLDLALYERKETLGVSLVDSAINKIMARHFKTLGDRIARMVSRTLLESITTRSLVVQLLVQEIGKEKTQEFSKLAYQDAIKRSKIRIEELEEIMQHLATNRGEESKQET